MKKLGILVFAVALVIGVVVANIFSFGRAESGLFNFNVSFGKTKGNGNVTVQAREVAGFTGIDVGGTYQVEVVAQKEFSIEVEADENLHELITTTVRNGTLHIESNKKFKSSSPVKIRIGVPNLDDIHTSGVAKVTVSNNSASKVKVDMSGASKVRITGTATALDVEMSGASSVDAVELACESVSVDSSGASKAKVNATGSLDVHASGASSINYSGTPANITKRTSGASSVNSL